jgi:hypothetical protein
MQKQWQVMNNNNEITNAELSKLNQQVADLIAKYEAGQLSAEQFYAKMYEYMSANEAHQLAIINILKNNGKTEEEANAFLEKILAEVKAGRLDAAEAYDKIMKELGDIKNILNVNLDQIKVMFEAMQKQWQRTREVTSVMAEWAQ